MLNIKQAFVPAQPVAAPPLQSGMSEVSQPVSSAQAPLPPKRKSHTNVLLGVALLVLLAVGGGTASYLLRINQDLRQQASGSYSGAPACVTVADCPAGYTTCSAGSSPGASGLCGGFITPTPSLAGSCGSDFKPTCSNINYPGCENYQTCHRGSNYDACDPIPGSNSCTYTFNGSSCVAQCPDTVEGTGLARCLCSNGVTTIGKLAEGGSCEQLCACTRNDCPTCNGTPGPTRPHTNPTNTPPVVHPSATPTPTLPPGPQCTNIKMFDLNNNELTGNEDQGLKPGQAVRFRCMGTGTISSYEFRVILPDGTVNNKATTPALNTSTNITGPYALPMIGHFIAQCRICYQPPMPTCPAGRVCNQMMPAPICQPYETIPTSAPTPAGRRCGGNIANAPTCPGGFTCHLDSSFPDGGGVCVPINNTHPTPILCGGNTRQNNHTCPAGQTCHLTNPRLPDAGGTCQ